MKKIFTVTPKTGFDAKSARLLEAYLNATFEHPVIVIGALTVDKKKK